MNGRACTTKPCPVCAGTGVQAGDAIDGGALYILTVVPVYAARARR